MPGAVEGGGPPAIAEVLIQGLEGPQCLWSIVAAGQFRECRFDGGIVERGTQRGRPVSAPNPFENLEFLLLSQRRTPVHARPIRWH